MQKLDDLHMLVSHLERADLKESYLDSLVFTDEDDGVLRCSNWRRCI